MIIKIHFMHKGDSQRINKKHLKSKINVEGWPCALCFQMLMSMLWHLSTVPTEAWSGTSGLSVREKCPPLSLIGQ